MDEEIAPTGFWPGWDTGLSRWFERLQGNAPEGAEPDAPAQTVAGAFWDGFLWLIGSLVEAVYNLVYAVTHPAEWLAWVPHVQFGGSLPDAETAESLLRFIYYGASGELLFFISFLVVILIGFGIWSNRFMWGMVRRFEGFSNAIGRVAAWAGLAMVLQQIIIIFMQRVFAVSELSIGFGKVVTFPISWWSEELKLYNAMVVTLCIAWTFVQGGHVRVDLIYSKVSFRARKVIDMIGAVVFMIPAAVLIWLYAWFFMWRHMVVPNLSASDTLDRTMMKARALRWNIETIGFSPNGFNGYFLFKVLLVVFTALVVVQAVTLFMRSYLEWREGEQSAGKYLDRDATGDPTADLVAKIH